MLSASLLYNYICKGMKNGVRNWVVCCIIFLAVFSSCSNDDDTSTCNVENPLEELSWLNDWVNSLTDDYEYIRTAKYLGNDVFYNVNCDPLVNYVSSAYNCEGYFIGFTAELRSEFTADSILWISENSKCSFE